MILLLPLILILAVLVALGFVKSRRQRRLDGGHRAEYVGFSAAVAAVVATLLWVLAAPPAHRSPAWQGFVFIVGWIGIVATAISFIAGASSSGGAQGWQLMAFGFVIAVIYAMGMFSHFGD